MTRAIVAAAVVAAAGAAVGCRGGSAVARTEDEKTIYALGAYLGEQARPLKLSPAEVEILKQGVGDAAAGGKLQAEPEAYRSRFAQLLSQRSVDELGQERLRGVAYQTQAAQEPGAIKTDSGLIFRSLQAGKGASPTPTDRVRAHYRGTLVNGTVFDSSYDRGKPLEFELEAVITCWKEALPRMKTGGKAKLVCPPELAYGDQGAPPAVPGAATLVFEVELVEVMKGK